MTARLDRTDLKILRLLQNNGRLANAELAEKVGLSSSTAISSLATSTIS